MEVVTEEDKYPLCIVWCTLPVFSWFLPFIGHLGVTDSSGLIHDFVGIFFCL
jgi:transmembrane protein 222